MMATYILLGGDGYASLEYTALAWKGGSISNPDSEIMHNEITAFHLTQIKAPNGRILNIHYRDIGPIYHQFPTRLIDLNQGADYAKKTDLLTQYLLSGKRTAVKYNVIENKLNFKTFRSPNVRRDRRNFKENPRLFD